MDRSSCRFCHCPSDRTQNKCIDIYLQVANDEITISFLIDLCAWFVGFVRLPVDGHVYEALDAAKVEELLLRRVGIEDEIELEATLLLAALDVNGRLVARHDLLVAIGALVVAQRSDSHHHADLVLFVELLLLVVNQT